MAGAVGGKRLEDYEPHDVIAPKVGGKGDHAIEVKSMIFGKKTAISVHENALVRKVDDVAANPGRTYHTVVLDKRHEAEGGAHADSHSGHEIYYKRAAGPYSLASMHKVKDMAELNRLLGTPNHKLPEAARGSFPDGSKLAELRVRAAKEQAYNNERSRQRKKLLGSSAYGR